MLLGLYQLNLQPPAADPGLELSPVFAAGGLALSPVFNVLGAPTIGTITPTATGCTFTWTGGATHYRIFELAGSPGAWVSLPASPVTVTGLTANTEYTLQLSGNGSTVADAENWGTLNPGVGGGGVDATTTISATVATADALGLTAQLGIGTTIAAGIGSATADGLQAAIALRTVIAAGVGVATAEGLQAAISIGSNVTIAGTVGVAQASGLTASIALRTTIAFGVGSADASGLQATITLGGGATMIPGGVGVAQASGLPATITIAGPTVIACGVGSAEALGLRAIIRAFGLLPAFLEQPRTSASWSYKQTATLWRLVERDDWGGQMTHELAGLFLCDYAVDDKRARSAVGDEYTTRLLVYTSLPGLKQGDMLKIGAVNEADPYKAGAHEVTAVTAYADTFAAEGPQDFRVTT